MTTILEDAQALVDGARRSEYGDPAECFGMIGSMWTAYVGKQITTADVAHMMILLKVARGRKGYSRANVEDIAGYAYCADLINRPPKADYVGE